MQDVNDDMDLFRRAAENYPLNTDSADFNEVLKKLPAEQSKTNPPPLSVSSLGYPFIL